VAKRNKPTLSKHDLVRAIKEITMQIDMLYRHVTMIDNVLDKYIHMNKDENKLKKYMEDLLEKKKNEQNTKHKQSGRSAKTSK
tara:strand:+ start:2523 stop:2771 length:249 start_codon:yes stop_codon:yes gene_type:complete